VNSSPRKRDLYLEKGVPEYWIVDTDARAIERWRSGDRGPSILADVLEWQPDPASPALVIDLPRYFDRVSGQTALAR